MARFRLPASVKVGSLTYAVKVVTRLDEDKGRWGEADHRACEIRICEGLSERRALETFAHELLHCIAEERGIRLKEHDCDQLAAGIAAVAVDNGWRMGT